MSLIREFEYKGKRVKVSVNKSGPQYLAVIAIEGMKLPPSSSEVTASHDEGAFKLAKTRAEELIDNPPRAPA